MTLSTCRGDDLDRRLLGRDTRMEVLRRGAPGRRARYRRPSRWQRFLMRHGAGQGLQELAHAVMHAEPRRRSLRQSPVGNTAEQTPHGWREAGGKRQEGNTIQQTPLGLFNYNIVTSVALRLLLAARAPGRRLITFRRAYCM